MTITDNDRNDLYQYCKEAMGERHASTLMALLPPVGWADVATKHDLAHQGALTGRDLASLRRETAAEFANVRREMRAEFASVRNEMRSEFASVRNEMRTEFASVRSEMSHLATKAEVADVRAEVADVRAEIAAQGQDLHRALRTHTLALVATNITLFGLAVATVRLA